MSNCFSVVVACHKQCLDTQKIFKKADGFIHLLNYRYSTSRWVVDFIRHHKKKLRKVPSTIIQLQYFKLPPKANELGFTLSWVGRSRKFAKGAHSIPLFVMLQFSVKLLLMVFQQLLFPLHPSLALDGVHGYVFDCFFGPTAIFAVFQGSKIALKENWFSWYSSENVKPYNDNIQGFN